MKYQEIEGNLITLAQQGKFDVIAHGCNSFCVMGSGIAPQMAAAFGCDTYPMEAAYRSGEINKLGQIEWSLLRDGPIKWVVNAYTQYDIGGKALDYEALTLCLRKMNYLFRNKHIGLPQIGCGLAGGDWNVVKQIIQDELKDCEVTIVIYKP